jgi:hypothetical protein
MKPIPPKCPNHVGLAMQQVGKITTLGRQGRQIVLGFRYRCAVQGCRACQTILLDEKTGSLDGAG